MRKLFIGLAILFAILGIVFAVLPLGTLALLPIGLALIFAFIAFIQSDINQKSLPKWILIVAGLTLIIVIGKVSLVEDEVAKDEQFEQKKVESKLEDLKDLEDIE
jgi:EamA domain-containing membrane protein RarD